MNVFSIRDIENLSGIKAHTLRVWEQRYDLINPKRKASKHRFYDNEDLKYILRIVYLYNQGYKISRIADLTEEEIRQLALDSQPRTDNTAIFVNQLTEASIDFDQSRFEKLLHHIVLHLGFEKSITQVIFPLLQKIGLLWMTGNVLPAQEHFASALIIKKMIVAIDGLEKPVYEGNRRVLLFTPEGELHEIPILFMQYLLKKNNTPCIYVGRNASLSTLISFCEQHSVTQLYFHLITKLIRCEMIDYLQKLARIFPEKEIIFSGAAAGVSGKIPSNTRYLINSSDMMDFAKEPNQ